jgi:hypothetical protein
MTMKHTTNVCGCCAGTQSITPQPLANRPGLSALSYRVGTHSTFLETMRARLSSLNPLRGLTTRAPDDPSIALLDAWATVADVLTFYQERIANEGYLRTATERRSVLELARLVGYALRPGVAASAWLALELDKDYEVTIQPNELKAQSIPGQGEMPQTFENSELLDARYAWNKLQPRLTQPQTIDTIIPNEGQQRLYVKGISTNLNPSDVVLIAGSGLVEQILFVAEVKPDPLNDRTLVIFQEKTSAMSGGVSPLVNNLLRIAEVVEEYTRQDTLDRFNISQIESDVAQPIIDQLNSLADFTRNLAGDISLTAQLADYVLRAYLKNFDEAKTRFFISGIRSEKLTEWLTALTEDLYTVALDLNILAGREIAIAIAEAVNPPTDVSGVMKVDFDPLKFLFPNLTKPASVSPRNTLALERNIVRSFNRRSDIGLQLIGTINTSLRQSIAETLSNVKVTPDSDLHVYVFRAIARPFGYNAPLRSVTTTDRNRVTRITYEEWNINEPLGISNSSQNPHHEPTKLFLDGEYKIQKSGWVVINGLDAPTKSIFLDLSKGEAKADNKSIAAYGISGKSTLLEIKKPWINSRSVFSPVRNTVIYCESEELPLAEEPIEKSICGGDEYIELDRLHTGLQSGRWLIVSGERDDIVDKNGNKVRGVRSAELLMLAEVIHNVREFLPKEVVNYLGYGPPVLPGDQIHTFIKLARQLEYCYRRDSMTLYGNVVKATHGETRKETLGSGDASQAFQAFTLKQPPLTFVASPTPAGAESTLKVYVNDVQWDETDNPAEPAPTDREFITKTDDEGKTAVIFGNGQRGARLPTGIENVRAQYRNGIGRAGNVRAEQISQLLSKPLGVKGVINPLCASGGADKESRDTARKNAPLAITALDRLVSVADYADFARTFAGIGKAVAASITDGKRQWVHVTIAGADDIPIDETSDLYRNLLQALHDHGDPYQPVALQTRELLLLAVSAKLRILPNYQWEPVVTAVRTRLLDTFSFERRELGQDVLLSEAIATIQSVPGVAYVDVDAFGGIPEKKTDTNDEGKPIRRLLTPKEISDEAATFVRQSLPAELPQPRVRVNLADFDEDAMRPAQLAYLPPIPADMLVLNQIQ